MSDNPANAETAPRTRLNTMPFGTQVLFRCPKGVNRECAANLVGMPGDGPTWENIGTDEKPTLVPGFHCNNGCGWLGYIVAGDLHDAPPGLSSIVACASCKHPQIIAVASPDQQYTATDLVLAMREGWVACDTEFVDPERPGSQALIDGSAAEAAKRYPIPPDVTEHTQELPSVTLSPEDAAALRDLVDRHGVEAVEAQIARRDVTRTHPY